MKSELEEFALSKDGILEERLHVYHADHMPDLVPVSVFLVGGDEKSGNVFAINSNRSYGPVCDDVWGENQANVVCRQLGFSRGTAYRESHWGSVPSRFAMDDV